MSEIKVLEPDYSEQFDSLCTDLQIVQMIEKDYGDIKLSEVRKAISERIDKLILEHPDLESDQEWL